MVVVRQLATLAVLGVLVTIPVGAQQEPNPNRLFVSLQTQLRPQPSPTVTAQMPIVRPGTLVTATESSQSGGFVEVTNDSGQKGWVPADAVRPLGVLEAEQQLEPFGEWRACRRWIAHADSRRPPAPRCVNPYLPVSPPGAPQRCPTS